MNYVFKTADHPEALGRKAQLNEEEFKQYHHTDEGGKVTILMGRKGMVALCAVMLRMMVDDPGLYREARAAARTVEKA